MKNATWMDRMAQADKARSALDDAKAVFHAARATGDEDAIDAALQVMMKAQKLVRKRESAIFEAGSED